MKDKDIVFHYEPETDNQARESYYIDVIVGKKNIELRIQNCKVKSQRVFKLGKPAKFELKFVETGDPIYLSPQEDPVEECENRSFIQHSDKVYPAVQAFLKEAATVYSKADCERVLAKMPSSFLREKEAYLAYRKLTDRVVEITDEELISKNKLNEIEIQDSHEACVKKMQNVYIFPRMKALQAYLKPLSALKHGESTLSEFDKKVLATVDLTTVNTDTEKDVLIMAFDNAIKA